MCWIFDVDVVSMSAEILIREKVIIFDPDLSKFCQNISHIECCYGHYKFSMIDAMILYVVQFVTNPISLH